ncbi:MAG TPA: hypothetical protein VN922_02555 [Bacteroidia bacterium]|nr:hypothetical protein [Bacteroidia bacterium]
MNSKTSGEKIELFLFYFCLLFNIWVILAETFHPCYDGPAHLYYSRVMDYMAGGNSFLKQYFVFNHIPVPNLADHYLLALFDLFFTTSVSEKLLLLIYFIGLPLSFRYLVSHYNPSGKALSIFIFPISHCLEFYMGGYNFCLSLTFLLFSFIYYIKNFSSTTIPYTLKKYIIFLLLTLLCYFTNGLMFFLLAFLISLYELHLLYIQIKNKTLPASPQKLLLRRYLLFILLWIPGTFCMVLFRIYVLTQSYNNENFSLADHFERLYNLRPLMVYVLDELTFTHIMLALIVLSLIIVIYSRIKDKNIKGFVFTDIFMLVWLIMLGCFFFIPNGAMVGGMTDRFCLYFFFFLVLWIALQKNTFKYSFFITILVVITHLSLFFTYHYPAILDLDKNAVAISDAASFMKPNSVVVPINFSDNWVEMYSCDYLGVDKPLMIVHWYEPDQHWFALNRNPDMPKIEVANDTAWPETRWLHYDKPCPDKNADYIFIYGEYKKNMDNYPKMDSAIKKFYSEVFVSENECIHIFELKNKQ